MDAYDEVSNARRRPDEPEGSVSAATDSGPVADSPASGDADPQAPAPAPSSPQQSDPDPQPGPQPDPDPQPDPQPDPEPQPGPQLTLEPAQRATGIAGLTLPYQIAVALVLAVVAVAACAHLGLVFLHIAPSNTLTKQHGRAVDEWVYPEFEQNWKLFAPNPLQQNISVQARAEVRTADGEMRETGWYDLSALDGAAIDRNPVPSHSQQNELRRAWDFYVATHDDENRATASRGDLSERYVRRIVVMRLDREQAGGPGGVIERIQLRSRTTNVPSPEWSEEKVSDKPVVRELSWWSVTDNDRTDAAANADGAGRTVTGRTEASAE